MTPVQMVTDLKIREALKITAGYGKNRVMTDWIFFSPHYDDIALSCGGLAWELSQHECTVAVWTICGGTPDSGTLSPFAQSLHDRWGTGLAAVSQRQAEDQLSCQSMHAAYRWLSIPDCIYRPGGNSQEFYYASEEALFGPLHPKEESLVAYLAEIILQSIPPESEIVCPLSLGGHVDHRLARSAVERIRRSLWYYADYPYVLSHIDEIEALEQNGWRSRLFPISPAGREAWAQATIAHASQISTFWPDLDHAHAAIFSYAQFQGGVRLWRQPLS